MPNAISTQAVIKQYDRYVMNTYVRSPLVLTKGKGSRVWDIEGHEYLDLFPGWGVSGLGYNHPWVMRALRGQSTRILHVSNNYYHPLQAKTAKQLVDLAFEGKVFFTNSGAEAVETAIKLARRWGAPHGRHDILVMERSFHGRTMGALSATGQSKYQEGFEPLLPGFIRVPFNDLEAIRRAQTVHRMVVASSDKAYGGNPQLPYREESPLLGRQPYDVSKVCADLLAQSYAATYDLPVAVTRCGNLFGGGDLNWSRIVPGTTRAALRGISPVIRSDGTLVRDYFFVKDAVDAYLMLAEQAHREEVRGQAYNFSENRPMTVLEICKKTLAAAGRPDLSITVEGKATSEIKEQWLDSSRARSQLGWKPRYGLEAGLSQTVRWYEEYLGRLPLAQLSEKET